MTDLELIRESVSKHAANILDANDRIWDYAELAFHEHKSAELLCQLLEAEGFTVQRGLAEIPTCFTGTYKKGSGKPVMGFLGEFDALSSLSQQAALPEKSPVTEGAPGHGCGHCSLGTGSLAARFRPQGLPGCHRRGRHRDLLWLPCRRGRRLQAVHGPGRSL